MSYRPNSTAKDRVSFPPLLGEGREGLLPFGELFIEERTTWNTPYKFSGKELDEETGYSYFGARYYDPNISIWLSVDPLSDKAPGLTPYNYTLNNPIILIDPNGMSASPVYDIDGNFLGTDDQGLQGDAIIMDKTNFRQGMAHSAAMALGITLDNMSDAQGMEFANNGNLESFLGHYNSLSERPDYDGKLSLREANEWYREGNGAPLYVNASKIDLAPMYEGSLEPGESKYVNYLSPSSTNLETGLVYGTIKLTMGNGGVVSLGGEGGFLDEYNFERHEGRSFRNLATRIGNVVAGKGTSYNIYNYGTTRLRPKPRPERLPSNIIIH